MVALNLKKPLIYNIIKAWRQNYDSYAKRFYTTKFTIASHS